jgi:hypothetical protein
MADGNTPGRDEIAVSMSRFLKFMYGSEESIPRAGIADLHRAFAQALADDNPMNFLSALRDDVRAAGDLAGEGDGSEAGEPSSGYDPLDPESEGSEQAGRRRESRRVPAQRARIPRFHPVLRCRRGARAACSRA